MDELLTVKEIVERLKIGELKAGADRLGYRLVKKPGWWIPCSERLPESGRYLVSCPLSVFSPQVLNYDEDNGEWFYDGCQSMDFEMPTIIAWMPLPEPYCDIDTTGGQI